MIDSKELRRRAEELQDEIRGHMLGAYVPERVEIIIKTALLSLAEEIRKEDAEIADNYDLSNQQTSTTSDAGKAANKTARNITEDIRAALERLR